jgi:hypothetical protein
MARIISSLAILASMPADVMGVRADGSLSRPSKERWSSGFHLGVDYYPSHWPEEMWGPDVARMQDTKLHLRSCQRVRLGFTGT